MKKTIHPRNHEERKVEKLLERIARKKSEKRSAEEVKKSGHPLLGQPRQYV